MRLAGQAKGGFYPTPDRVVNMVATLMRPPYGYVNAAKATIRALDPCCGAGDALGRLTDRLREAGNTTIETYGVELHKDRAEEAAERLDHVLPADAFQTSIANGAFGLLFLNAPYDWEQDDKKRVEHAFLTHCTRYLVDGGVLVFIVPRQRLAVSARFLSTHYTRVRCWAFPDPERDAFDQVVLMAVRRAEPSPDGYTEAQIREWAEGEPETLRMSQYAVFNPPLTDGGRRPLHAADGRSRGGCHRGSTRGTVDEPPDHGCALARDRGPHPSAHAAPARSHGHAGGGGIPRQSPARGRRSAASSSRGARRRRWSSWTTRRRRRCSARGSRRPSSRSASTTARSPTSPPRRTRVGSDLLLLGRVVTSARSRRLARRAGGVRRPTAALGQSQRDAHPAVPFHRRIVGRPVTPILTQGLPSVRRPVNWAAQRGSVASPHQATEPRRFTIAPRRKEGRP